MSSALSVGMAIDPAVLFPRVRGTARRDAARRDAARRDTVALPTWRFGLVYDTCPMSATDWDAALQRMLGRIVATGGQVTDGFPHYGDPATGRWTTSPAGDWTGGFWNGLCGLAEVAADGHQSHAAPHRVLHRQRRLGLPVGVLRSRHRRDAEALHAQGYSRRQHVGARAGVGNRRLHADASMDGRARLPRRGRPDRRLVACPRAARSRRVLGLR